MGSSEPLCRRRSTVLPTQSPADKLIDIYGANYRQWLLHLAS